MNTKCNHNCRQGRDCDCRQDTVDVAIDFILLLLAVFALLAALLSAGFVLSYFRYLF